MCRTFTFTVLASGLARAALVAFALASSGCDFAPQIASGSVTCGQDDACPPGYLCNQDRICCAPGDEKGACAHRQAAHDASVPGAGGAEAGSTASAPVAADAAVDTGPPTPIDAAADPSA